MRTLLSLMVLSVLAVTLFSVPAMADGTGLKIFVPTESSVSAEQLPLSYDGSFIVQNDGPIEGVYVVRVAVDYPGAITWINVTPAGFALAPGESRQVWFSIDIGIDQAAPGTYQVVFIPSLLPQNVEPYLDTFARYASTVDYYNFTVAVGGTLPEVPYAYSGLSGMPVSFGEGPSRVNLVQYIRPEGNKTVVAEIDRYIRINVPSGAEVGRPANVSISVFEDLSSQGIDLVAISPEGIFYPIEGGDFTFDRTGRWGVIALIGDLVLLGKPVDVSMGGVRLALPGWDTIFGAIALLMLVSLVPIWLLGQPARRGDPYEDLAYKAYVIKKYIDQFDHGRLSRAVGQLRDEYNGLVARKARGDRDKARAELDELETLASYGA